MSAPEFGPGGYLPQKAAKRARKIVLREQMGFGWPLAAVGAALIVVIAGGLFLRGFGDPPPPPFVAIAPLDEVPAGGALTVQEGDGAPLLVVRATGTVRVFAARGDIIWCADSQRLEVPGASWMADGRRAFGNGPSLQPLESVVFDGEVYVNVTNPLPPPPAAPSDTPPACAS